MSRLSAMRAACEARKVTERVELRARLVRFGATDAELAAFDAGKLSQTARVRIINRGIGR